MKTAILDAATLGDDVSFESFKAFGDLEVYRTTAPDETAERVKNADAVVVNKIKLNENNLAGSRVKLICVAATGFDNIDTVYCKSAGICVCNVPGYSTDSVAQLTLSIVLYLVMHMSEYTDFVRSGEYALSGVANKLSPVFHELNGKTWGIVGFGAIGKKVAKIAEAFGCRVIATRRTPSDDAEYVDLYELCRRSDIISLHTPLTPETRGLIGKKELSLMKKSVILVNAARGAVTDEKAVAEAIKSGTIGAFGSDVYSAEPFTDEYPLDEIKGFSNVCLTPHMAWGAYEARVRCLGIIKANIEHFLSGYPQNRIN